MHATVTLYSAFRVHKAYYSVYSIWHSDTIQCIPVSPPLYAPLPPLLSTLSCTDGEAAGIAIAVLLFVGLVIAAIRVTLGVVLIQRQKYKGRLCKQSCMHTCTVLYCTVPLQC